MAQRFSITQKPQFDLRGTPMIPGTDVMQGSVMENFPIDSSKTGIEQLILNNIAQLSDANEGYINTSDVPQEQNLFDYLQNLSGGVVNFAKDIAGRSIASQALSGAGGMVFGLPGALAGLVFGGLKGGDLFKRDPVIADIAQSGNPFGLNMRRDAARISNMLQRGAAGKNFSQTNLDNVLGRFGITGIDTGGMMDSIAQSAQTGYGGYGSSDDAAAAAASGGRDYSSSPGAMAGDMEYGEE
jgi:hypothetical protein